MKRRAVSATLLFVLCACLALPTESVSATSVFAMTPAGTWGSDGLGPGEFTNPPDVTADKWGNVYVAGGENGDHRIQMFSSSGELLASVGTTGTGPSVLDAPRSVTTDRWGNVWVAELGNTGRISRFHPGLYGGTVADSWTGSGSFPDNVSEPLGIGVGLDGSVYTSLSSSYVQKWSGHGDYQTSWTTDGPTKGVAVGHDGEVYAVNDNYSGSSPNHLMAYDPWGALQDSWGGYGTDPGQFDRPYDVGVDAAGHVFVIESQGHRGQVFMPDGTHLRTFGSSGSGIDRFFYPYGIGVGLDRTVYVADTFNNRVSKWTVTTPATTAAIEGANRYATAKAASERAFPPGSRSEYAVVCTGLNWPDALGGAALAGALKAPLLLTDPNTLSAQVTAEIARLDVQEIYVLGGDKAVVYTALAALVGPGDIRRLQGADRYLTANRIAQEVVAVRGAEYDGTAFVVTGKDFPDALAVSPIAAANGWPILLTDPAALPGSVKTTMQSIGVTHGYIIGKEGAVGTAVEDTLNDTFIEFTRYGGANRYATAATIAQAGFDGMGMLWSRPALATGENFPDALAGGVLQGSDYSVMLLTPTNSLHPAAAAALASHANSIYELRFLGGTSAVSPQTRASAAVLLP